MRFVWISILEQFSPDVLFSFGVFVLVVAGCRIYPSFFKSFNPYFPSTFNLKGPPPSFILMVFPFYLHLGVFFGFDF